MSLNSVAPVATAVTLGTQNKGGEWKNRERGGKGQWEEEKAQAVARVPVSAGVIPAREPLRQKFYSVCLLLLVIFTVHSQTASHWHQPHIA